jgi:hypothetical protein
MDFICLNFQESVTNICDFRGLKVLDQLTQI